MCWNPCRCGSTDGCWRCRLLWKPKFNLCSGTGKRIEPSALASYAYCPDCAAFVALAGGYVTAHERGADVSPVWGPVRFDLRIESPPRRPEKLNKQRSKRW